MIQEETNTEYEKCLKSPYYFATTYFKITKANGEVVPFTTHLTEEEFNLRHQLKDEYYATRRNK